MGNWWLAATSQQHTHSCISSHAEIFGKTSNHPGDSAPLQPRFGTLQLHAFPKIKITFEQEEISDCRCNSGKYNMAADGNWENCVRSQGAYSEGNWSIIVLCTMFLVSSSLNVSTSHSTWLDAFWTDLIYDNRILSAQINYDNIEAMRESYFRSHDEFNFCFLHDYQNCKLGKYLR